MTTQRNDAHLQALVAKALLENAAQGVLVVDDTGRILHVNPALERLFGYAPTELTGQKVEILLPAHLADVHRGHRADYFSDPRTRPMGLGIDLAGRRKDGTEFPVEISLSYVDTEDARLAVALVSDVTERVRAEEQRRRLVASDEERGKLQAQLQQATKMEAVGRLAGGIAHDFNNLLTAMSGFSEILLDYLDDDDPLREGAEENFRTCQRSAAMVRQLLAVSRRQMLQPVVMDLNRHVRDVETMLRGLIGEDILFRTELQDELGYVKADPAQMEQVLLNLVVNARDAMPRGGALTVRSANAELDEDSAEQLAGGGSGPYVVVSVSDTGHGMDHDTLSHVFEPFFTTKTEGKGTGLGLATVYGIVKQSGGVIWAYSEPGKGTTFKVYLPRVEKSGEPVRATAVERGPRQVGSETVLVVEDANVVRLVVREALKKAGYRVLEARNADDALTIVGKQDGPIHLIVTDVVMPGMNGPELADRIASLHPGVRRLYMSGYAEDAVLDHGIEAEGLEYLEKPFTRDKLTSKVRQLLDS